MLIPSQAHVDLLRTIISDVQGAAIKALEAATGPMKLVFPIGAISFHIWLLALNPVLVRILVELHEIAWLVASPAAILLVVLGIAGFLWMWIEVGGLN